MTKKNHIHRLKRHKYKNGEVIFFCVKDDCSFKVNADLTWGKTSECWRCSNPFAMGNESKRQDKPHCDDCTNTRSGGSKKQDERMRKGEEKKKAEIQAIKDVLDNSPQDLRSRLDNLMNSSSTAGNPLPSEKYPDEDML